MVVSGDGKGEAGPFISNRSGSPLLLVLGYGTLQSGTGYSSKDYADISPLALLLALGSWLLGYLTELRCLSCFCSTGGDLWTLSSILT